MEKVVLIYPHLELLKGRDFNIPLGLLHLGTYLDMQGIQVRLVDCNVEKDYKGCIASSIEEEPICIGISAMTAQLPHAIEICTFVKEHTNGSIPIVFGGVHTTLFPEQMILHPLIDFAIVGEGELSLTKFILALRGDCRFDSVEGLCFLDEGHNPKLVSTGEVFDYGKLPLINYDLLNKDIVCQFPENKHYIGMLTSRGCPYMCTFCINTVREENRRFRAWEVERTIQELERLIYDFGVRKIWFWDDGFFVDKNRVLKLMDKIEERNLRFEWFAGPRADYFRENYLNEEFLKRLYRLGCRKFGIGAESGSPRILEYLQKGITIDDLILSADMCEKSGIQPTYSFMIGLPTETRVDIQETVSLTKRLSSVCSKSRFLGPQLYRPYPGSKLYEECINLGLKESTTIEEWIENINSNIMETDPFKMPWIKYPHFVNSVGFYCIVISIGYKKLVRLFLEYCRIYKINRLKEIIGLIGLTILKIIGKIRYDLNIHHMLIEKRLLKKYRAEVGC